VEESRYNFWVGDGPRSYVYNGISGRTVEMLTDQRDGIQRFIAGDDDAPADPELLQAMARANMIVVEGVG